MQSDGSYKYGSLARARSDGVNPRSIHLNRQLLSTRESTRNNVWKSQKSYNLNQLDLRMVPTLLKENVRLFTTPDPDEVGMLYMKEEAFYNRKVAPEYALSVSPEIYQQLMTEVNDSSRIPLGLYFCCHGGDGAHSGVAHSDFVEIQVACIIVAILIITMLTIACAIPMPSDDFTF